MSEVIGAPRCGSAWTAVFAAAAASICLHAAAAPRDASQAPGPVVEEGTLEVLVEDHPGFSRMRHVLKTDRGARRELRFKGKATSLLSGSRVRVRGEESGSVLMLADGGASVTQLVAAPPAATSGEQKVAVLLVNFADDASQPYTVEQANDVVFGQAGSYVRENSFQLASLAGSTFGWLALPINKTCATSEISSAAHQAASAAGIDLAAYRRLVYVFPKNLGCGWSGVGSVGGSPSEAWLNVFDARVTAHELGHNFGLQHSHARDCDATPVGTTCSTQDYGDVADVMGSTTTGHFNAFQKERLGWLNSGQQPPITTVTATGSFVIGAYETANSEPKALKVPRGVDPLTGAPTWYYIEYRRPFGFDAVLPTLYRSNLIDGVLIRTGTDGDRNSSFLLDMTPNTVPTFDMTDAALTIGQVFNDAATGVMVTVEALDASGATVRVTLSAGTSCVRAAPLVNVVSEAATVAAATPVVYTATVTNKDTAACGASPFSLAATAPSGWSVALSNPTVMLMPGASASTALTVASTSSTPAGSYTVITRATNGAAPSSTGSASASYTVAAAGGLTASVSTSQPAYRSNETVAMTAGVSAGGAPVASAEVTFTLIKPNGSTVTKRATTDGSGIARSTYRIGRKDPAGNWLLRASVGAAASSAAATTAFSVQ